MDLNACFVCVWDGQLPNRGLWHVLSIEIALIREKSDSIIGRIRCVVWCFFVLILNVGLSTEFEFQLGRLRCPRAIRTGNISILKAVALDLLSQTDASNNNILSHGLLVSIVDSFDRSLESISCTNGGKIKHRGLPEGKRTSEDFPPLILNFQMKTR